MEKLHSLQSEKDELELNIDQISIDISGADKKIIELMETVKHLEQQIAAKSDEN